MAEACSNQGILNGSTCLCPIGFGGSNCSQPACGGNIFQGSDRSMTPFSSSGFANLTEANCSCQNGWTGTGCNVCQAASACQSAYSQSGSSSSSDSSLGLDDGQNSTLVCNTAAKVWSSSQMSCNVNNPTLQSLFPLLSTLTIARTLDPSLSPIPNVTSFGASGSVYAQFFYAGVEQFYCHADSCVQDAQDDTGQARWDCQNLQCTCIPDTTFCARGAFSLNATLNDLSGTLAIDCGAVDNSTNKATCGFQQDTLNRLFGSSGLRMEDCSFGECLRQSVIDNASGNTASADDGGAPLSGGVIAGLAVVGGLVLLTLIVLLFGLWRQRKARKAGYVQLGGHRATVVWDRVSYLIPGQKGWINWRKDLDDDKIVLDSISGRVPAGQMMAILGPSGAGKTTLVEILAGKRKSGVMTGSVSFPCDSGERLRIGFVPQQDILPPMLTVYEALLFAARLRLPEGVSDTEKQSRVQELMEILGIAKLRDVRIGSEKARGISGGEMRRLSIGLELIASPDVLILDEPTSGLDSVSASRVANVLHDIAHDSKNPIPVIVSIHQPSSQLYQIFDSILLLAHGRTLYSGPGSFAPVEYMSQTAPGVAPAYQQGYNVADYLLDVASEPPLVFFQQGQTDSVGSNSEKGGFRSKENSSSIRPWNSQYATTFLTQFQYLSGREWRILRRDKALFLTHVAVAAVLGVFCGGLYYQTDTSIAGFQSRVGCLFFLGALIAFSSLSALYNVVETRPLFLRERSSSYYSPTSWLLSRFFFDVIPLRVIPTVIVSTVTYWMAGLASDAVSFFKFLFILVLYSLAITLFNFLLGTLFENGGIAILLSALTALYQMTYAGFFTHLNAIPPVLRWLQWLCPLKYCLEALAVNEVGSGLMIEDTLEGVPVNVSASLIMNLLFGFSANNYYRDVLVLFAFIAGFGLMVIGVVWFKVRERR